MVTIYKLKYFLGVTSFSKHAGEHLQRLKKKKEKIKKTDW